MNEITVVNGSFPLLSLMIALPAVVALLLWLVPGLRSLAREMGMAVAIIVLGGAIYALATFNYSQAASYQFAETYSWVKAMGLSWALGLNGLGLAMVALSALLTVIVLVADWNREEPGEAALDSDAAEDDDEEDEGEAPAKSHAGYVGLTMMSLSFMVMIFAARDLLVFYLAFEAMLIPMFFLIGRYGQGAERRKAAMKFLLYSLAGGLIMLVGVVTLYAYGTAGGVNPHLFTFETLVKVTPKLPGMWQMLVFITFFFAFAVKAPMVPVHTWLADAAANARPGTSTLLVGVMDKIGTYGMITFCLVLFPGASHKAALTIVILAIISVLWGAFAALAQKDILRLISFTSVSHFGIMVMGIFIGNKTALMGAMIYMVAHGLSIAAMFLIAGFLVWRGASQEIDAYGGMQRVTPVLAGTFLTAGLAAIALPGLSGFVPELLVLLGSYKVAPWAAAISVFAVIIAAVYILLPYQKMFTGPVNKERKDLPDLNNREKWVVVAPLIALMLILGLYPKPLADMVSPVAEQSVIKPMVVNTLAVKDSAMDGTAAIERSVQ